MLREKNLEEDADSFLRSAVTKQTLQDRYPEASGGSAPSRAVPNEEVEERLRRSTAELTTRLNAAGLRKHFEGRMEKLRAEQVADASKKADMVRMASSSPQFSDMVTSQSKVRIAREVACQCAPGSDHAMFKRGSQTMRLPIAKSASFLINELSDGQSHSVETLTCDDPVERLCVCQVLINKDCVEIDHGQDSGNGSANL